MYTHIYIYIIDIHMYIYIYMYSSWLSGSIRRAQKLKKQQSMPLRNYRAPLKDAELLYVPG